MFNTKKHIFRRGLALLNPYHTGIFTINIIIVQSRKLAILVTAYHDYFLQCVSPIIYKITAKYRLEKIASVRLVIDKPNLGILN